MSLLDSIKRHAVGIACEMLTIKDPYDHYEKPRVISETRDCHGNVVSQLVRANSGSESTKHLKDTNIQGDRSIVSTHLTHIRRGLYDVHIEEWEKQQRDDAV